ncbi:PDZ domain-containing protein [Heliorestis acidaminivorans]|uniref:PDZ domain-containing protein n=1 Tax=Heliorestis acidaminivorans TaxID=553427 RepID=A0A6I0FAY2_9FIRM|nr:S41 family peptidase [Heliorestis acidaminivorans]KAB2954638.1 PDZ domain-containing protein [Heliorestis acidaminivorans]
MRSSAFFTFLVFLFLTLLPVQAYNDSQEQLAVKVESEKVESSESDESLLIEIRKLLKNHHIDQPNSKILELESIEEILEALGDPYTSYLTPQEEQALLDSLNLNYAGIGMVITQVDNYPAVERVFPNSPAEKSGIGKGDKILQVDELPTEGLSTDVVASKVRGPEGTKVTMKLMNALTGEPYVLELTRQRISIPQAEGEIIGNSTGYLRLYSFGEKAGEEFAKVYNKLRAEGMDRLLLDLRGNGGGSMTAAELIGDFLLPEGPLYHLVYHNGSKSTYHTEGSESLLPMVILIDEHTASAAELLSAALKERSHALLIGANSYGKGSVQSLFPLDAGGVLKVTIARYQSPQGITIDQIGLTPDLSIGTRSLQLIRAKEILEPPQTRELRLYLDRQEAILSGEKFVIEQKPMVQENRAYLPLRFIVEALGGVVEYEEVTREALLTYGNKKIPLSLHSLVIVDDRTFAPVRMISEQLGYIVEYNEESREILLASP